MHRSRAVVGIVVTVALVLVLALLVNVLPVVASLNTEYVDDDGVCGGNAPCHTTIGAAVAAATSGETIIVYAGTYPESVLIDKANLIVKGPQFGVDPTVAGARTVLANEAIITGDGVNDYSVRIGRASDAAGGGTGVTFDGFLLRGESVKTTRAVYANRDNPTISNNIIEVANFAGDGIALLGEHYPIDSATISQNYIYGTVTSVRAAIRVDSYFGIGAQATIKNVVISGNKVVGTTNFYDDGIMLARSTGTVLAVWNVTVTDNLIQGVGAAGSAGIDIYTDASGVPGVQDVTITGNTIDPWNWGIMVDYLGLGVVDATKITVHCNIIFGNTLGANNLGAGTLDATNNWWGCNAGPGALGCDTVSANVLFNPWLVLNISANPPAIVANGTSTSTITADMTENSAGIDTSALGYIPDGTQIIFDTNKGSIGSPAITKTTTNGKAQATLTSSTTPGTATVTAKAPPHTAPATATTTVQFVPGAPHNLTLTANPTSIVANGVSTSTLTATVKDATGNAVANGTSVYFSTVLGTLGAPSRDMIIKTTTGGVATAILTSTTTPGTATVEAMAGSIKDSTTVQFTAGAPHSLTLTANPTAILANGVSTSTLTATVKDVTGNPVADGTSVYFSTDLGIVAGPSRDMVVKTTTDGVATAVLTSTTTAGVATVEAASDGATDSIELPMLPLPPDRKKPPHRAKRSVDSPVKFRWAPRDGAVEYNLEVYRKGGSWVKVIDKVLTRRRFKTLLLAGKYKWRVSAGLGDDVWGPWPSITETGQRKWFRFKVR